MRSLITAGLAGIGSLAAVATIVAMAGPALAAPTCTGASCSEGASVVVQATITETITPGSFSFNYGNPSAAGFPVGPVQETTSNQSCTPGTVDGGPPSASTPLCPDYTVTVTSGDGQGITLMASATDLANAASGGKIAATNLSVGVLDPNTFKTGGFTNLSNTPATLLSTSTATALAGNPYPIADSLVIPGGASGTYAATLTYGAVAN